MSNLNTATNVREALGWIDSHIGSAPTLLAATLLSSQERLLKVQERQATKFKLIEKQEALRTTVAESRAAMLKLRQDMKEQREAEKKEREERKATLTKLRAEKKAALEIKRAERDQKILEKAKAREAGRVAQAPKKVTK